MIFDQPEYRDIFEDNAIRALKDELLDDLLNKSRIYSATHIPQAADLLTIRKALNASQLEIDRAEKYLILVRKLYEELSRIKVKLTADKYSHEYHEMLSKHSQELFGKEYYDPR